MSDIRNVVRGFILQHCLPGEPPESLRDDAPLRTSGLLDSQASLRLVSALEAAAGIEIEAHEVSDDNFDTVDDIVAFVEDKQG